MQVSLPQEFVDEYNSADNSGFGGGGDLMPAGQHQAKIIRFKTITDVSPGKYPFFVVTWTNTEGHEAEDIMSLSPKAMSVFASKLRVLNITVSDPNVFYPEVLLGRYALITIQHQTKTGTSRSFTNAVLTQILPPNWPDGLAANTVARDGSDPKWEKEGLPF
jgi:hypothetical protein